MSDYFKLKQRTKISEINETTKIPTSDFAAIEDGYFVQLEYVEEEDSKEKLKVKPGIFTIVKSMGDLKLESTSFSEQKIYTGYDHTARVTDKIDRFFSRLHIYNRRNINPPKRGMLLYGPPGCGKSQSIKTACEKYNDGKTLVVLWQTDKYEPYDVKEFIKRFEYNEVERLILVAEDIGGVEIDQVKMKSDSSLLALLDNSEKAFSIPTYIIATTNFPEIFLENLTRRKGRLDDLVEIPRPNAEQRLALYNFIVTGSTDISTCTNPNVLEMQTVFKGKRFDEFTAADINELDLFSELNDLTHLQAAESILEDIKKFKDMFQKKKQLGIGISNDYE